MLLTEFFNVTEGESYANCKTAPEATRNKQSYSASQRTVNKLIEGSYMDERSNQSNEDFVNYFDTTEEQEVSNDGYIPDLLTATDLITQALREPSTRAEYFNFIKGLRATHGAEYSTTIHQKASELAKANKA